MPKTWSVLIWRKNRLRFESDVATMDDCCRIAELLLGAPPSGETALTVGLLTILSLVELSVSAVYTANPLSGDGISIDVEYIPSRRIPLRG